MGVKKLGRGSGVSGPRVGSNPPKVGDRVRVPANAVCCSVELFVHGSNLVLFYMLYWNG